MTSKKSKTLVTGSFQRSCRYHGTTIQSVNINTFSSWDTIGWKQVKNRATNFISWEGSNCWRYIFFENSLGWTTAYTFVSGKSWQISYLFEFTNLQRDWLPGLRKKTVTHVNIVRNDIQIYLINLRGPKSDQITEKDNSIPNGKRRLELCIYI